MSLQLKSSKGFRAPGYFHRVPANYKSPGKTPRSPFFPKQTGAQNVSEKTTSSQKKTRETHPAMRSKK